MARHLGRPDRRLFITAGGAGLLAGPAFGAQETQGERALVAIEARIGGRLGVSAVDTGSGRRLRRRAGERFAMASTFKVLLAGAVSRRIDRGDLTGARMIPFGKADLLSYAPRTTARVDEGAMSVFDLCAAAVEVSDNTAANLLLAQVGGPAGLTEEMRGWGDPTTRLDRTETALNTNLPGDPRDTTTPDAFAGSVGRLVLGNALSDASRARLTDWMVRCETGGARLRAGLPAGWRVGDKTGTGDNGAVNDVAVAWPPGRAPIVMAVLLDGSHATTQALNDAHAAVARIVAAALG